MNRDDPRVRIVLSMAGLILVVASLIVTFRTGSTTLGWGLLLLALVCALILRWKR